MKRILLALALFVTPLASYATCTVNASDGTILDLCSLANTFVFSGTQVQTISVQYRGNNYVQTFTYAGGQVSNISAWILTPDFVTDLSGTINQVDVTTMVANSLKSVLTQAVEYVTGVFGTSDQVNVSPSTPTPVVSLSSTLVTPGSLATPNNTLDDGSGNVSIGGRLYVEGENLVTAFGVGFGVTNPNELTENYTLDLGTVVDANEANYASMRIPMQSGFSYPVTPPNAGDLVLFNINNIDPGTDATLAVTDSNGNAYPVLLGNVREITASGSTIDVLTTDYILGIDSTSQAGTVLLYNNTDLLFGNLVRPICVKDIGGVANSNHITVTAPEGVNIDGASTKVINTAYGSFCFFPDQENWFSF